MENSEQISNVVGITGGIGTGKSTVSKMIENMGFPIINTDNLAKEIISKDTIVRRKLVNLFGEGIFTEDGQFNSKMIADIVFEGSPASVEKMLQLNSIVHPPVIQAMIDGVEELEAKGEKLIFIESALIFEAELDDGFDYIIVVDAPEEVVVERLTQNNKLTETDVIQRINSQMPQSEKIEFADFVIDNSKSPEDLEKSVNFIMDILKAL